MKRIIVLCFLSIFFATKIFAQCTPDTSLHSPGLYPDSATGLTTAIQNMPYNQVIQLVVPSDTIVYFGGFPFNAHIDSVSLSSLTGMPSGFSISCNPSTCTYPGGTTGCALISGTTSDTGNFQLTAIVTYYATVLAQQIVQIDTVQYYKIRVNTTAGVHHLSGNTFSVEQNQPNPFHTISTIEYNLPQKGEIEFRLFNVIGKEVYHLTKNSDRGPGSINIDAHDYPAGVYIYSMSFERVTLTKRLVIESH